MRPMFRILADSKDVTEAISDRLLELSITDEAGIKSDQVRITLDDRRREDGGLAALPRMGMTLEVSLGYAETSLRTMGKYLVDEVELRHPPATLTVGGKAADMAGTFKNRTSYSWDNTTLGEIVNKIAAKHGYTPKVDKELAAIVISHEDQRAESDMALLTRLAEKHDAVAKPVHGHLVLARAGEAKTTTGADLPVINLALADITSWSYKQSARSPAPGSAVKKKSSNAEGESVGGCKARWWDYQAGKDKWVTVGKEPFEDLPYRHKTEAEAKAAAAAKMNKGKRKEGGLSLPLPGNPNIAAECRLHIALRPGLATDWRITKVEHRLGSSGYTTQVEAELFLKSQEKVTVAASAAGQGGTQPKPDPKPDPAPPTTPPDAGTSQLDTTNSQQDGMNRSFQDLRDTLEQPPAEGGVQWETNYRRDKALLCIPDIAEAEAQRRGQAGNIKDARGYYYLSDMLRRWFSGTPSAGTPPYVIDWEWAKQYPRAMERHETFCKGHILNPPAKLKLAEILQKDGKLQSARVPFDYIRSPHSQWERLYHTAITVDAQVAYPADGLQAALAGFTFRALAQGYTSPNSNGHDIAVQSIAVFVHDSFNFDGFEYLGYWQCNGGLILQDGADPFKFIYNSSFRDFAERNQQGKNFIIYSLPHIVESFVAQTYTVITGTPPTLPKR